VQTHVYLQQGLREATIAQIEHFGQTPTQLMVTPHPKRCSHEDVMPTIFGRLSDLQLYTVEQVTPSNHQTETPLLFIHPCVDRILTIGLDRILSLHMWKNSRPEYVPPFSFELEKKTTQQRRIGVHFAVS
jgi:hypothetical protein